MPKELTDQEKVLCFDPLVRALIMALSAIDGMTRLDAYQNTKFVIFEALRQAGVE